MSGLQFRASTGSASAKAEPNLTARTFTTAGQAKNWLEDVARNHLGRLTRAGERGAISEVTDIAFKISQCPLASKPRGWRGEWRYADPMLGQNVVFFLEAI